MEGIDVPGTNPDLLEDEEDFEEMNDDYFAEIGCTYEVLSSYSVKEEPLDDSPILKIVNVTSIDPVQFKEEICEEEETRLFGQFIDIPLSSARKDAGKHLPSTRKDAEKHLSSNRKDAEKHVSSTRTDSDKHLSSTRTDSDKHLSCTKRVADKPSNSKRSHSSDKRIYNEKARDARAGPSKLNRTAISEKEGKKRDSEMARSQDDRSSRVNRSSHDQKYKALEHVRARAARRSPPYSQNQRSRSRERRSSPNRGNNRNTPKKPTFLEEITTQYPVLKDQIHNAQRQNQQTYIPQQQMMPFPNINDGYSRYGQPMGIMYNQQHILHPQPVPAPSMMQYQQQFDPNQIPYQNPMVPYGMPAAPVITAVMTQLPASVPNPPSWQYQTASPVDHLNPADTRIGKQIANTSSSESNSLRGTSPKNLRPVNITPEADNGNKSKKIPLSDLLSQKLKSAPKNHINDCAKLAVERCKRVLNVMNGLEHKRFTTRFLHTKFQHTRPYLMNAERRNKTPMIMSESNPLYRSVTLSRDSLLSFPYTNLCYKKSFAHAQAIGVDLNELSAKVRKRNDIEKLRLHDKSVSDAVLSNSCSRDFGVQTEVFRCMDCAERDLIVTTDKAIQALRFVPSADKEVQTTKNAGGFHFSIDSVLELSHDQRRAIQDFKAKMGINDDNSIVSLQERLQHRAVQSTAWQGQHMSIKQEDDRPGNRLSQSTHFDSQYANPSPPEISVIKPVPFGDEDLEPETFQNQGQRNISMRLGRRIDNSDYTRDDFANFPNNRQEMSPRHTGDFRRDHSAQRRSRSPIQQREASEDFRDGGFLHQRHSNDSYYNDDNFQGHQHLPDNSNGYYSYRESNQSPEEQRQRYHHDSLHRQGRHSPPDNRRDHRVPRERSNDDYRGQRYERY